MPPDSRNGGSRPPFPPDDPPAAKQAEVILRVQRDHESRRLRLMLLPPEDPPFGQPSTYSLSQLELARHVRSLRRQGWQGWEIRQRFTWPA